MQAASWRAWSGAFGLAFVALQFVVGGIYFSFGKPMSATDITFPTFVARNAQGALAAMVATALAVGCAYVWILGLQGAIKEHDDWAWNADFTFVVGAIAATLGLLGTGLQTASLIDALSEPPEPGAVRALFEAGAVLIAPVSAVPTAVFIASASCGIRGTSALPRWIGTFGYVAAILVLLTLFTVYFGQDPANAFSIVGIGTFTIGILPFFLWAAATSVALLRSKA